MGLIGFSVGFEVTFIDVEMTPGCGRRCWAGDTQ